MKFSIKSVSSILGVGFALIAGFTFWYSGVLKPLEVMGAESGQVINIPEGGKAIFSFSRAMKRPTESNIIDFSPAISFSLEWKDAHTLELSPQKPFMKGEEYIVSSKNIQDIFGNTFKDFNYTLKIVDRLQVTSIYPNSEGGVNDPLVITFNNPMVPLQTLDDEDKSIVPDITLSPSVSGKWQWLGTSALKFTPSERWQYATKYLVTLPRTLQDIQGSTLEKEINMSFTTPIPAYDTIEVQTNIKDSDGKRQSYPLDSYKYMYAQDAVILTFNQKVSIDTAKEHIGIHEVNDGNVGKLIPIDIAYDPSDNNKLILTPQKNWEEKKQYVFIIDKGIKSAEGDLVSQFEKKLVHFSSASSFSFVSSIPKDAETLPSHGYSAGNDTQVHFQFSVPPDSKQFAKNVTISPKTDVLKPDDEVYINFGDALYDGYWSLKPSTKYTVTFSKSLPDIFGRILGKDISVTFTTAPLAPNWFFESRASDFGVFESSYAPEYRFKYLNLKQNIEGDIAELSDKDVMSIIKSQRNDYAFKPSVDNYKNKTHIVVETPNKDLNKTFVKPVSMEPYIKKEGDQFMSGAYLVDFSSPEVLDYNGGVIHNQHIFFVTPYALSLKYDQEKLLVWATSLENGAPVSAMVIRVFDKDNNEIHKVLTNDKGLATIPWSKKNLADEQLFYAVGEKDSKKVFTSSDWNNGISPWNFSINQNYRTGQDRNQYVGNIYTDRPLYKPGEKVYFKGIVRKYNGKELVLIPKNTKVSLSVKDPDYNEVFKKTFALTEYSSFVGDIDIPTTTRYGDFSLVATVEEGNFSERGGDVYKSVWVSHFQKAPFKVTVSTDKQEYFWGDSVKADVLAETFYGSQLSGGTVASTVFSTDYYFNRYPDTSYSFGTLDNWCYYQCSGNNHSVLEKADTLDAQGKSSFTFPIESKKDESSPAKNSQVFTVESSVQEANTSRSVTGKVEFIAHFSEIYMGVKMLDYIAKEGDTVKFSVVSVNPDGSVKPNTDFKAKLIKREYKSIKKEQVDGSYYYDLETKDTEIKSISLATNEDGKMESEFTVSSGGNFIVQVSTSDSHNRLSTAEADLWVSSRNDIAWPKQNHDRIDILTDKQDYKVGDTAKLFVKTPFTHAKALLTIEQGTLLETQVIDIDAKNPVITLPIKERYIPNFYVSVVLFKGRTSSNTFDASKKDLGQPDYKVGYATLRVNTAQKTLSVSISPDKKEYSPQENVNLQFQVKNSAGKGVVSDVAVYAVDMSLLALTGYTRPDPVADFYFSRDLGVLTSLSMTKFVERFKPGSKGGAGGDKKLRGEFKNTAYFLGSLITDAEGNAKTNFKLPDNLTTWKITAVAETKDHRFGAGDTEILETKHLLLDPTLPQFLTVGDEIQIPVNIVNNNEIGVDTKVSIEMKDTFTRPEGATPSQVLSAPVKEITLGKKSTQTLVFTIKAGSPGETTITFHAISKSSQDDVEYLLRINPLSTKEVVATSGQVKDTIREFIKIPEMSFAPHLSFKVSATLASLLPKKLEILQSYPYGCAEQIMSKIFPSALIIQNNLLKDLFTPAAKEVAQKNIENGMAELIERQNSDGSFGYFSSDNKYSAYLTSYILIAFETLKEKKFPVNEVLMQKARSYLESQKSNLNDISVKSFVYWALSINHSNSGDKELAYKFLQEEQNASRKVPNFARAYLALFAKDASLLSPVLAAAKQTDRDAYIPENEGYSAYWSTTKRTTALTLYALEKLDPKHPLIPKLMRYLNQQRMSQSIGNTQEEVWALLALIAHIENEKLDESHFTIQSKFAGNDLALASFNKQAGKGELSLFSVFSKILPLDSYDSGTYPIDISLQGTGKSYYDLALEYFVPAKNITAREEGFSLQREYFDLDGKKITRTPNVGTTFKTKLTFTVKTESHFTALEDLVPAGMMPINTDFQSERQTLAPSSQERWSNRIYDYLSYTEFRDDRAFFFFEELPAGVYSIEYPTRVTHSGHFSSLPARIFEMYNEDKFARTKGEEIDIK